jgi:cyclophilin family peptidyl-prolyl cis-trans isomerase
MSWPVVWLAAAMVATPAAPSATSTPSFGARARLLALADARTFDGALLRSFAADPDSLVRRQCALTLGELANADGAPILAVLSADRDAAVRASASESAGRLAGFLPERAHERAELGRLLERALRDPDPAVRAAAAWGVGIARPAEGELWLLHRLARERSTWVRAAMLRELWRFSGKLWPKRAMSFLADRDPEVRYAAAWSLARSTRPEAAAGLRRAAQDGDPRVRVVAYDGARRLGQASLWTMVVAGVADPDRNARVAALMAVEALAKSGTVRPLQPTSAAQLARAICSAEPAQQAADAKVLATWGVDPHVAGPDLVAAQEHVAAIRAAGAAGCCEKELRVALATDAPWISEEALGALVRQHAVGAMDTAAKWVASTDPGRRREAACLIPLFPDADKRLVAALADPDAEVRLAAVGAASEVPGPAGTAALAQRLGDADPVVSAAAVEELARRKAPPLVGKLVALLDRARGPASPDVADALIAALATSGKLDVEAKRALEEHLTDKDPVVARSAWAALVRSGASIPPPKVETGKELDFYRHVEEWAGKERFLLIVTVRGTMQVRLDTMGAPLTCYRLVELAERNFFDNLTFHRVVPDFVIQGGDPRGDGWGGPGYAVRDELGLEPFSAGAVGIALSGPDTGGSQFFVTLTRQPHLDGRYPRIGTVANGLEVASRIRVGDRILRIRAGEGALPLYLPVWYGPLAPPRLDAEIPGWREGREKYHPQPQWLDRLRGAKLRYGLRVAMGTWCSDSIDQVPRLEAVLAALGSTSPFDPLRLIGIDRSKVPDPALYKFGPVELSPTIVVTAGDSEVGRIVETPKSGSIEEDLVRILAPVEGWDLPEPSPAPTPGG